MRYEYPVVLEGDDVAGWTVTSPDVPELVTGGATRGEAVARAEDALVSALSFTSTRTGRFRFRSRGARVRPRACARGQQAGVVRDADSLGVVVQCQASKTSIG